MLSYGRKKLKNTAISYVDSYAPLGLTLGDLSASLRVEDGDGDGDGDGDAEARRVGAVARDTDTDPDDASELYDRVTARMLNRRRSKLASRASEDVSSNPGSDTDAELSDGGGGGASDIDDDTTIEFVIPSQAVSLSDTDDSSIVDLDAFSRGITLLSMALNNELIVKNPKNIRKFTGQAVAHIVNSILDPETLLAIFASLSDETKLQILKYYLSDDLLVDRLKSDQGLHLPGNPTPPSSAASSAASSSASYIFHRRSYSSPRPRNADHTLDQLIISLLQAFYTFSLVLYTRFGIPLLNLLWKFVRTLNENYKLLDIAKALTIRVLALIINLILKLVVHSTNIVQESTLVAMSDSSTPFSAAFAASSPSSASSYTSSSAAGTAGNYARDAFFAVVQQGIVRATQKRHSSTTTPAPEQA